MTITPIKNTTQLVCENSNQNIQSILSSFSMVAVLQKVDLTSGYTFYQCNLSPNFVEFVNYQHLFFDKKNMIQGMTNCITNHYTEGLGYSIPQWGGSSNLAQIVLGAGLVCKMSGIALTNTAYRFCLTLCTPSNSVPDNSLDKLGEWCSTLALAKQSAISIISGL